jgi:hypothetical protein
MLLIRKCIFVFLVKAMAILSLHPAFAAATRIRIQTETSMIDAYFALVGAI